MKKIRRILCCLLLSLIPVLNLSAQAKFGLITELGQSKFDFPSESGSFQTEGSLNLGFFFEKYFSTGLGFGTELFLMNARTKSVSKSLEYEGYSIKYIELKFNSLAIPLYLKYRWKKISAFAGPQIAIQIKSEMYYRHEYDGLSETTVKINGIETGMRIGLNYAIVPEKLFVVFNYYRGKSEYKLDVPRGWLYTIGDQGQYVVDQFMCGIRFGF